MSAQRRRVLLDCDPGHDDALAILLAAASPLIDLVAITTVAGNQRLEKVTLNARRVCSVARIAHVPVVAGCDRPLVGPGVVAEEIHGVSGLDGPEWDEVTVPEDPRHAVDLLVDEGLRGGLTVIATGPLTNVATALLREPRLAHHLDRVVTMGGAVGLGNWTPSAEFNIYADPEAADVVFRAGIPVTLVPLEVTHQAIATPQVMERIADLGNRVARLVVELIAYFEETYRRVFGFAHPPVHDPCAVAAVIDAGVMATRELSVLVDLDSGLSRGRTVVDVYRRSGRPPNVEVGLELDPDRFWDLMIGALARYPA